MVMNNARWVDIDCVGEQTATPYAGKFSIKPFLTRAENADAVRLAELYARGIDDPFERSLLRLQAFLKFHIVDSDADWWNEAGMGLYDERPIYALSAKLGEYRVEINPKLAEENKLPTTKTDPPAVAPEPTPKKKSKDSVAASDK